MKIHLIIFLITSCITISAQENVLKAYDNVFIEAQKNDKNVILVFGHEHCGWCRVFNKYHATKEAKNILASDFIIHKIDMIETEAGKALYYHYKLGGTPAWMIFSWNKELLFDGKNPKGNIIGYPLAQTEIDQYLSAIRRTSKNIKEQDLQVLANLLKELGNRKKQGQIK